MTSAAAGPRRRRTYAPRVPAEQRRAQLLDAALHLVATRGHAAVTMDQVAERAGVTKPVVYGMYANRAELLSALLARESEQALAQVLDVVPDALREPVDVADVLDRFLGAVRANPQRWTCVVVPLPGMPPEFHSAREQARAVAIRRAEVLARQLLPALGGPAALDPEVVAHTVVTLFEMAARLVLTDPDHYPPHRFTGALRAAIGMVR